MELAIDLGASNVKIAAQTDAGVFTSSFKSLATTNIFGLKNVVTYNSHKIAFGAGNSLIEQDKTERKYLEETIILAASIAFNGLKAVEVDLGIGLPIHTYKSQKKAKFKLKLDSLVGTVLKGDVDGNPIAVSIKSIEIFPEGYSAFLEVAADVPKLPTTFIDWGYKTTDVINLFIDNGEWALQKVHTVPTGIYDVLSHMKEQLYNNDIDLKPEQIDHYLRNTPIIPTKHGATNLKNYLDKEKFIIDGIMSELKVVMPDIESTNIYLSGGGATIAKDLIGKDYNIFTIPEEKAFYANALGYLLQLK